MVYLKKKGNRDKRLAPHSLPNYLGFRPLWGSKTGWAIFLLASFFSVYGERC